MGNNIQYTFLEWNIRGAGGYDNYTIPDFVIDTILDKEIDIIVIVEFYVGGNFEEFSKRLQKSYRLFISPFTSNHNQVLIALKKSKFDEKEIKNIITLNPLNTDSPEYLQINIETQQQKAFSIIGTRIKTSGNRKNQFCVLDNQIKLIDKVICLGDFNLTSSNAKKFLPSLDIYGPRTLDNIRWSFVHDNGNKVGIDLIAVKNIKIPKASEDELSKKEGYKMYAIYDWNFITEKNGYEQLTASDCLKKISGKPDHAILIGCFEV